MKTITSVIWFDSHSLIVNYVLFICGASSDNLTDHFRFVGRKRAHPHDFDRHKRELCKTYCNLTCISAFSKNSQNQSRPEDNQTQSKMQSTEVHPKWERAPTLTTALYSTNKQAAASCDKIKEYILWWARKSELMLGISHIDTQTLSQQQLSCNTK